MTTEAAAQAADDLLREVLDRQDGAPDRLRELLRGAVRHLHAYVREVGLTPEEWTAGIRFLTSTGQISDDVRQEFILLSDTLGVSSLVESSTTRPRRGPPRTPCSDRSTCPARPLAATGRRCWSTTTTATGSWSAAPSPMSTAVRWPAHARLLAERQRRLLRVQQPEGSGEQPPRDLPHRRRRHLRDPHRAARRRTRSRPTDPSGRCCKANGRGRMRPGHIHTVGRPPGYKELITHVFDEHQRPPRRRRRVRRPRQPRCARFVPDETGELAATFDVTLVPSHEPRQRTG